MNKKFSISWDDASPRSSSDDLLGNWDEGSNGSFNSLRFLQQDNSIHDSTENYFTGQTIDTGQEMGQNNEGGTQHLSLLQQLQVQNRNDAETNDVIQSEFTGQSVYQRGQVETSSSSQPETTQIPPQRPVATSGNHVQEMNWASQPQPQGQELSYALQIQQLLEQALKQQNVPPFHQEDIMRQQLLISSSNVATDLSNPHQDQLAQYLVNVQQQLNTYGVGDNQKILMRQQLEMFPPQYSMHQVPVQQPKDQASPQLMQDSSQTPSASQYARDIKYKSKPPAPKKPRRTETKIQDSSKTKAVIANHREATEVIGNTMKSLNNTIRSIHEMAGLEPAHLANKSGKRQMISGSMKSLSSTLASTMMAPPESRGNASWNIAENGEYCTEPLPSTLKFKNLIQNTFAHQGAPIKAYAHHVHYSPPETNQSYSTLLSQNTAAAASNMNIVSSDTDCEFFSTKKRSNPTAHQEKPVTSERYLTESGTDDDAVRLGVSIDVLSAPSNDEKMRLTKERNREHAKNTRLRKKAYVESLKQTVDELCRERDSLVSERANAANMIAETHSKRVDVLRSFFALRAGYSLNQKRELWSSILDESGFTCRLPITPYQSFPSNEVQFSNCQRTISGVDAMIADVASNAVFFETLVDRYHYPMGKVKFQYTLVTEDSVTEGNQIMARWSMETLNARQCGARIELHQQGMLFCKFNSAHKIVTLDITFDVMAFMLQVKMAMGFENFNDVAIPNTVQTCQKQYDYPMVMTLADRPYTIVQVNERWENLTGYTGAEVVGKRSCSILQGSDTGRKGLERLMSPLLFKRPSCGIITNYTKNRRRYRSYLTLYPLSTDSNVSHYFGLTTFVQWIDTEETVQSQAQNNSIGTSKTGGSSS